MLYLLIFVKFFITTGFILSILALFLYYFDNRDTKKALKQSDPHSVGIEPYFPPAGYSLTFTGSPITGMPDPIPSDEVTKKYVDDGNFHGDAGSAPLGIWERYPADKPKKKKKAKKSKKKPRRK